MENLPIPGVLTIATTALSGVIALALHRVLWNIYFHPLARFPGPTLGAASSIYEAYFDLKAPGGQFIYHLQKLHDQYGPLVRASPNQLHVRDPEWFDTLYAGPGAVRDKEPVRANGSAGSVASAVSHELHRARRGALNPFFSKRTVNELEVSIRSKVDLLCEKLSECAHNNNVVELGTAFNALTLDIITGYCFDECFNALSEPDFAPRWKQLMIGIFESVPINKHFPIVLKMLMSFPDSVLTVLTPPYALFAEAQRAIHSKVREVWIEHHSKGDHKKEGSDVRARTIFHGILQSTLPDEEKSLQRLADEAFVLIVAGAETTAKVLTVTLAHLIRDKMLFKRLQQSLKGGVGDDRALPTSRELEGIPLMKAVVQEGIRIAAPVTNRQVLMAPNEELECNGWIIPRGTPISMTLQDILFDPSIFPNPHRFDPDRWIRAEEQGERLDRYLVSFSKGTRACLGMNLAYAEIYLAIAAVVSRFDVDLVDFDQRRDLDVVRDHFIGFPSKESQGVRVKVKERR